MLTGAVACGDGPSDKGSELSAAEWCKALWDDGLAPVDWDQATFNRDCLEALESGYTRPMLRDIYENMKDQGA